MGGIIQDAIEAAKAAIPDKQFVDDVASSAAKMAGFPKKSQYGENGIPTEDELSKMPWLDLMELRSKLKSKEDQNAVAPFEHRAYAREQAAEGAYPALQQAVGSVFYTPVKAVTGGSRSDPSFREIGQGLLGVLEGLAK